MEKLVSIVLPTYNGEKYLALSIESVLKQSYQNWELIIVNDCSTDSTLSIAQNYAQKDKRIKIISNSQNLKLPAALNVGFRNARGEYYSWTSDDNQYKPDAIKIMVEALENDKNIDLVYCDYDHINEKGEYLKTRLVENDKNIIEMVEFYGIGACFLYTKNISKIIGEYDEKTFCAEDQDYFCRLVLKGNIKHLETNQYIYLQNSQNLTATKKDIVAKALKSVHLKYAIPIMKKMKYSKFRIVKTLMTYYKERKHKEWFDLAKKENILLAYIYYYSQNLKLLIFEKIFYLNIYKNLLKNKKIMFWGASLFLEEYITKYNIKNKNILGIIDKNEKRKGETICGYKIYSPEEIKDLNPDIIILSIKNNHNTIYPIVRKYLSENLPKVQFAKDYFVKLDNKQRSQKKNRLSKNEWSDIYNKDIAQQLLINIKNKKYPCQVEEILKIIKNNSSCLEVGCGSAMSSIVLAKEKGTKSYALDYSQSILNEVKKISNKLNLEVGTICLDAFKEPALDQTFDYIFHSGLLEHFTKEERTQFLKNWKPYCKTMVSMVPNAASIVYRTGKSIMEKDGTWKYGLEMPLYTQIPEFLDAGYKIEQEYTIGVKDALSFLPQWHPLRDVIEKWNEEFTFEDNCHQGYLLVTIGSNE